MQLRCPASTAETFANKLLASFITAIAFLGIASQIQAAEIWCPGDPEDHQAAVKRVAERVGLRTPNKFVCMTALLKGTIVAGDFDALKSMLRGSEPYVNAIVLWSDGGDVAESIKIGNLIRERMIKTIAPSLIGDENSLYINSTHVCRGSDCYCASACFFIWSAGIARSGDAIVVHRPRDVSGTFGRKPATAASSEYAAMLGVVSDYLSQMDVPRAIIADMNAISSNNASYLPKQQIETYLDGYVPAIHEWLIAYCGAMTEQEENHLSRLRAKFFGYRFNPSEEAYFNLLDEKQRGMFNLSANLQRYMVNVCGWRKNRHSHRQLNGPSFCAEAITSYAGFRRQPTWAFVGLWERAKSSSDVV